MIKRRLPLACVAGRPAWNTAPTPMAAQQFVLAAVHAVVGVGVAVVLADQVQQAVQGVEQ